MTLLDVAVFALIAYFCVRGYQKRQLWLALVGHLLGKLYHGKGYWRQLFVLGPLIVAWLLLCHWLNNKGVYGLAAGGILFAMTLALDAMRGLEERQKREREGEDKP